MLIHCETAAWLHVDLINGEVTDPEEIQGDIERHHYWCPGEVGEKRCICECHQ